MTSDKASGAGNKNAQEKPPDRIENVGCDAVLLFFAILFATSAKPLRTRRSRLISSVRYLLLEEVCRNAIRVPFNSKRLSRQT